MGKRAAVEDGRIVAISGMSRSGKTSFAVRALNGFERVVIWDPDDELSKRARAVRFDRLGDLIAALRKAQDGPLRACYVPGNMTRKALVTAFGLWSRSAFAWCVDYGGPVAVLADELADVSNAGKAPEGWGQLIRRGAKHGLNTFAISQRWSEADKTTLGNAARMVAFRASNALESEYVAQRFRGVQAQELEDLRMKSYIELDRWTGARYEGVVNPAKDG